VWRLEQASQQEVTLAMVHERVCLLSFDSLDLFLLFLNVLPVSGVEVTPLGSQDARINFSVYFILKSGHVIKL
jgi:hypothetical protein